MSPESRALYSIMCTSASGLSLLSILVPFAPFCVLDVLQLKNLITQPSNFLFANHKLCTVHLCHNPFTLELVALSLQTVFKLRDASCLQGRHAGQAGNAYIFLSSRREIAVDWKIVAASSLLKCETAEERPNSQPWTAWPRPIPEGRA